MAEVHLPILERVQIASPCDARWEDMKGDDKVRHCGQCSLNVHNLSAMTRAEAEGLVAKYFDAQGNRRGGRFCAMLYRRADGTLLTADCPVGLAAVRARVRRGYARLAALAVVAMSAVVALAQGRKSDGVRDEGVMMLGKVMMQEPAPLAKARQPFRWVVEMLTPRRAVSPPVLRMIGDVACPPSAGGQVGGSGQ